MLREIVRVMGASLSEIVMTAIELYYRQGAIPNGETPYEIAQRHNLIGAFSGPCNLASEYKAYLGQHLASKLKGN